MIYITIKKTVLNYFLSFLKENYNNEDVKWKIEEWSKEEDFNVVVVGCRSWDTDNLELTLQGVARGMEYLVGRKPQPRPKTSSRDRFTRLAQLL